MLITLYNDTEKFSFSNKAGLIYIKGLGNIRTDMFQIGMEYEIGSRRFKCRRSMTLDVFDSLERGPQVVTPKDVCYIGLLLDLHSCEKLLEIGGGSGSFSIISALIFGVKVTSYEINSASFEIFRRNVKRFELEDLVTPINGDGRDANLSDFECIFIDNPQPWSFLESNIYPVKKIASLLPTYAQADEFSRFLSKKGFLVSVHELIDVPMKLSLMGMRPETSILYHTGFIVSGVLY
ncbi:MAG: hypothetical protein QXL99_01350 [Thermoplasmatales archaeon]